MSLMARIATGATLQQVLGPTGSQAIGSPGPGLGAIGPLGRTDGRLGTGAGIQLLNRHLARR